MKTSSLRPLLALLAAAFPLLLLSSSCRVASKTQSVPVTPGPTAGTATIESTATSVTSRPDSVRPAPPPPYVRIESYEMPVRPFHRVEVKPQLVNALDPVYPEMARKAGVEGNGVVEVIVDTNGTAMYARIQRGTGNQSLDESALAAARRARFTPGRIRGSAVRVWMPIPFEFQLPQPDAVRPEPPHGRDFFDPAPEIPIVRVDRLDAKPQLLSVPTPTYPEIARKAGIEGQAVVEVLVDTNGTVVDARALKSSGNSLLDASAMDAARGARFTPPKVRGKVVRAFMPIRFQFTKSGEVSWTTD